MKIHSLQFKFLIIVISTTLAIAFFVGGLSIRTVDNYIQQQTTELVNTTCSNEATRVNDVFGDIEKSVRIMEGYVLFLFENTPDIKNHDSQKQLLDLAGKMFVDVANNTDGAVAYYLRFDPTISDGKTGMFYSKLNNSNDYVALEPTDLSLYDKNDVEHVGWFWQPYEAGTPIWMDPYYNQNNGILMISFVIPLYVDNQFVGVVGMDFDYTVLTDRIDQIKIYDNGFAHLERDGVVIYSGNENAATEKSSESYLQVSKELANGMTLVLSASNHDIRQFRQEIAIKIALSVILLSIIFSCIVFFMVKNTVKPLKKLTDASISLSKGDYDVEIAHSNTYEINLLNTAFETMLVNLREHKKLQHLLAYRDSLTGLRNTTSYKTWVVDFNKKIQEGGCSFGIVMLDLNNLKETNDTHGHDVGNKLILAASQLISNTFKRSPIFRIGGDEFLVILQNRDLEERDALFAKFDAECVTATVKADHVKIPVSIAKGFTLFDPATDIQFSDVFNRADEKMYKNKKIMKASMS